MKLLSTHVSPERSGAGWFLLAAIVLFAALATPFFAHRVYVADDLGEFHLPVRDFYARQLAAGEAFDWMPSLYGGFYVAGEGQLGGYHPWHWLLYRVLPLGAAFNVEVLANYPLLFAGMYLLLRRLVGRRDAALLGATAFTFGGFALLHFIHPNAMGVVAHLPWLLWAIDIALGSEPRLKRALAVGAIGLLTASQLLLGYPQYVWFSLLAEAGYVGYLAVARGVGLGALVSTLLAVAAGVLIGAIQWVPTWHLLRESVRGTVEREFANIGSLHPLNVIQLLAPYLFEKRVVGQNTHELGLYVGAVPLVLVVWLLARRDEWGSFRPLVRGLLVGLLVSLLLAAGEFGGIYRLQAWLPLANRFRFPCRAIVLVQLCLTALAAVGAALLFAKRKHELVATTNHSHMPLLLLVLFATALALVAPLLWPEHVASAWLVWSGPALIATAALLILGVAYKWPGSVALLAAFMAADLGVYGISYSVAGRTADLHQFVAGIPQPPALARGRIAAPDGPNKLRTGDRMLLAGINRVDGYAGLEPAKRLDYSDPRVLAMAGTSWQLLGSSVDGATRDWKRIAPSAPRARLITQALPPDVLGGAGGLPWEAAVCEPAQTLPKSQAGTARVVDDRPGKIAIEVSVPTRQVLALTESFDPGWTARVGGRSVPVVRVNGDFLGCVVTPGGHLVQLEFQPRARQLGGRLAMLGLGLLAVAAVVAARSSSHQMWPEE